MRASSDDARWESSTPSVVSLAAVASVSTLPAISPTPIAISLTPRFISPVVAVRSSTAAAIVIW
jgi:hypothetical protein